MTVPTTSIVDGPYAGNGVTTAFAYNFKIDETSEVDVYETTNLGVTTLLTLTTHYTVSGVGSPSGGNVTRVAGALPTGYTWNIRAAYVPTQATAFASQGGFFPDVHEYAFDKLSYVAQQHEDLISRSIRQHEAEAVLDMRLPLTTDRLGTVLAFDETTGVPVVGPTIAAVGTVAASVADIATVAADIASVILVATDVANVNTVAGSIADVNTVAGSIADVNTVAGSIADVNTVATNIASVVLVAADIPAILAVFAAGVAKTSTTGSAILPSGTTAQRDGTPSAGYTRFNSTLNQWEGYNGTTWTALGGGATGGVGNYVFIENDQIVTEDWTTTAGKNSGSFGDVEIDVGVTVTITAGTSWTITG